MRAIDRSPQRRGIRKKERPIGEEKKKRVKI